MYLYTGGAYTTINTIDNYRWIGEILIYEYIHILI